MKMIDYKIFNTETFRSDADLEKELSNLCNYQGWEIICSFKKKNTCLILQREVNYNKPQVE